MTPIIETDTLVTDERTPIVTDSHRAGLKYKAVFGPADSGEWSLPPSVLEARAVHARILAAISTTPPAPTDPRESLVAAALAAEDPASLDVGPLLHHQSATAERDHRLKVLRAALDRAAADLDHTMSDGAEEIITEHLTPALDKLWTEITEAVETLGDLDPADITTLLAAPDKTRAAYLALDSLAARYNRLREAWSRVPAGSPEHDAKGEHAEFELGIFNVWPQGRRLAHLAPAVPPWSTTDNRRGRLIWLARAGAAPWLPTCQQRDQAWKTANAEALARMTHQQQRHHQAHGWGGAPVGDERKRTA